jgi:hypothetical protein
MLKGHLVLRNDLVEVELIEQARAILARASLARENGAPRCAVVVPMEVELGCR